jgi:hypothetical protein
MYPTTSIIYEKINLKKKDLSDKKKRVRLLVSEWAKQKGWTFFLVSNLVPKASIVLNK